jgi:hypothetical protein
MANMNTSQRVGTMVLLCATAFAGAALDRISFRGNNSAKDDAGVIGKIEEMKNNLTAIETGYKANLARVGELEGQLNELSTITIGGIEFKRVDTDKK